MTEPGRCACIIRPGRASWTAARAAVLAAALLASATAGAQDGANRPPVSPPTSAPVSRLVITPAEFERWRAGMPERPDVAAAPEDLPPGPGLVAPPPPMLARPPEPGRATPPAAPKLVEPPPLPTLVAPPPSAGLPAAPEIPSGTPGTEAGAATPRPGAASAPPAPVLTPPEAPRVATLPPDSRDTTPVPETPERLPRPAGIRILYAADATDLPQDAHEDLDGLAGWLKANPDVRVQIVGYASAAAPAGSTARRRSLFRTLAVRTYLIENGVLSTRMDVRALGDRTDEEPKDRVDVRLPPS